MSIIDSSEEVTAAQARLETASDEQLERDLVYWATATQDAVADYEAASEALRAKKVLYLEAQQWTSLTVVEIRRREGPHGHAPRPRRRGARLG